MKHNQATKKNEQNGIKEAAIKIPLWIPHLPLRQKRPVSMKIISSMEIYTGIFL